MPEQIFKCLGLSGKVERCLLLTVCISNLFCQAGAVQIFWTTVPIRPSQCRLAKADIADSACLIGCREKRQRNIWGEAQRLMIQYVPV